VEKYGEYSYAITVVGILTMLSVLGFPMLIVREGAKNIVNENWPLLRGLIRLSHFVVIPFSLLLSLLAVILALEIDDKSNSSIVIAVISLLPLVVVSAAIQLQASVLQGLKFIIASQIPSLIIQRVGFIVILFLLVFFWQEKVTLFNVIAIQISMSFVALICSYIMYKTRLPKQLGLTSPSYNTLSWIKSAATFLLISGVYLINKQTDILMIGFYLEPSKIGIYRAVIQGSDLVVLVLIVGNLVIQPHIASLYAKGDTVKLQKLITRTARIIMLSCLPMFISLLFFGDYFLTLFGNEFIDGTKSLTILATGQLVNVFFGSVGVVLSMAGYERDTLYGVAIAAIVNIVLNMIYIPEWGIEGAAFASSVSLVIWNIILAGMVNYRTGLHTTALGVIRLK